MINLIKDRISEGYKKKEIAEHYNVTVDRINREIRKSGYENFKQIVHDMKYGDDIIVKILDMIEEGYKAPEICKRLELSEVMLRDELSEEGYQSYMEARTDLYFFKLDIKTKERLREILDHNMTMEECCKKLDTNVGDIAAMLKREEITWTALRKELMKKNKKVL